MELIAERAGWRGVRLRDDDSVISARVAVVQRLDTAAHAVEDRAGQPAANLVALKEAPQSLAGDAKPLGRASVAVMPVRVLSSRFGSSRSARRRSQTDSEACMSLGKRDWRANACCGAVNASSACEGRRREINRVEPLALRRVVASSAAGWLAGRARRIRRAAAAALAAFAASATHSRYLGHVDCLAPASYRSGQAVLNLMLARRSILCRCTGHAK